MTRGAESENAPPPLTRDDLVADLAAGAKPPESWRIGAEHEKFLFDRATGRRLAYDGSPGIRAILEALADGFGWQREFDGEHLIALKRDGAAISLEPGGQFELSGAPHRDLHAVAQETAVHFREVRAVADTLGVDMCTLGFDPVTRAAEVPWMPKARYAVMRRFMRRTGRYGLDMMGRTCTVQVNLDHAGEADMVRKFRVGLALQPLATALFANSPIVDGRVTRHVSWRSRVWTDTDPARCGMLPFVFEPGMGFERYVDYALDVPMYFVRRDGEYHEAHDLTFRRFMAEGADLPDGRRTRATLADWSLHLTTLFPEVRLKGYLEMRGADAGGFDMLCALPAFWTGLLYDGAALDGAAALAAELGQGDLLALRRDVPEQGLAALAGRRPLAGMAREALDLARGGLARRARLDGIGDESRYLDPLAEIVESGLSPGARLVADAPPARGPEPVCRPRSCDLPACDA